MKLLRGLKYLFSTAGMVPGVQCVHWTQADGGVMKQVLPVDNYRISRYHR